MMVELSSSSSNNDSCNVADDPNNSPPDQCCSSPSNGVSNLSSSSLINGGIGPSRRISGSGKDASRNLQIAVIISSTIAWLLFEKSRLSFVTACSDVLLLLVMGLFFRANGAALLNKQLPPLPELVVSEEMVHTAAASFRAKLNYMLLLAHDVTNGKNFKVFFKVVFCLWLMSILGGFCSIFTFTYLGVLVGVAVTALYSKYEAPVDEFLRHSNFFGRTPTLVKPKDH